MSRQPVLLSASFSVVVTLLACSSITSALGPESEPGTATPETGAAQFATPQGGGQSDSAGPTIPGFPWQDIVSGATSPPYDIYVGANVHGTCGPFINSGGFLSLTFDSVFHGVRFSPPSDSGLPGPYGGIQQEGQLPIGIPGVGLLGSGELGAFSFCPMYEGDIAHACQVVEGPHPFEPSLALGIVDPDTVPVVPLAGTPPAGEGPEAMLVYSIGATAELGPILTWDGHIGLGALGGSLEPVQVPFQVHWDQLMRGEEFEVGALTGDAGETWEWTIRFVPAED